MISLIHENDALLDPFTIDWINNSLHEYPVAYGHRETRRWRYIFWKNIFGRMA